MDNIDKLPNLLNDISNKYQSLTSILTNTLTNLQKKHFKRQRKLTSSLLLYTMLNVNGSSDSYQTVLDQLKTDKIIDITKQSVIDKIQEIDFSEFNIINDDINKHIYSDKRKRNIAVDCVRIHLYQELSEDGLSVSQNGASLLFIQML